MTTTRTVRRIAARPASRPTIRLAAAAVAAMLAAGGTGCSKTQTQTAQPVPSTSASASSPSTAPTSGESSGESSATPSPSTTADPAFVAESLEAVLADLDDLTVDILSKQASSQGAIPSTLDVKYGFYTGVFDEAGGTTQVRYTQASPGADVAVWKTGGSENGSPFAVCLVIKDDVGIPLAHALYNSATEDASITNPEAAFTNGPGDCPPEVDKVYALP